MAVTNVFLKRDKKTQKALTPTLLPAGEGEWKDPHPCPLPEGEGDWKASHSCFLPVGQGEKGVLFLTHARSQRGGTLLHPSSGEPAWCRSWRQVE
jgi:hypothetical protein